METLSKQIETTDVQVVAKTKIGVDEEGNNQYLTISTTVPYPKNPADDEAYFGSEKYHKYARERIHTRVEDRLRRILTANLEAA